MLTLLGFAQVRPRVVVGVGGAAPLLSGSETAHVPCRSAAYPAP